VGKEVGWKKKMVSGGFSKTKGRGEGWSCEGMDWRPAKEGAAKRKRNQIQLPRGKKKKIFKGQRGARASGHATKDNLGRDIVGY